MKHSSNHPTTKSTLLLIVFILSLFSPDTPRASAKTASSPLPIAPARVAAASQNTPAMFIENVGQFDSKARFQVRGAGGAIYLAPDEIWVTLIEKPSPANDANHLDPFDESKKSRKGVNLRFTFVGANPNPQIVGFDPLDTRLSYFTGSDPAQWRSDVPVWGGARYVDLYPGVDLEITSENGKWLWRLVANDPLRLTNVKLRVKGHDALKITANRLQIDTLVG